MHSRAFVAVVVLAMSPALAFETEIAPPGTPVDLASLHELEGIDETLRPVGLVRGDDGAGTRFYVAPIIGASWGQFLIDDGLAARPSLFTGGAAAGVAIARPFGQLRIEGEGRYRDGFQNTVGLLNYGATDNWSALCNVWRDFGVTERMGIYGGAGIGGGGYRFTYTADGGDFVNGQRAAFAWQAGGGVIYAASDRVTLDLGYRYYGTDMVDGCDCGQPGGLKNQFLANELLFAIRIYEPFRGLLR